MPMKKALLLAALGTALVAVPARAADYTVDPNHSKILFKVKHLGISTVTGRFEKFTAGFAFDPANSGAFQANATIEANSVNTDVADRDNDLRSANFFEVAKYPQITFASKGIKELGKNKYEITGDLTIRGVTKPIVLAAELGGLVKDPWGNQRAAFSATGTINRKDFGLLWNKVLETGGLLVGEEVQLILEVEGIQKKTTS